MPPTDPRHGRSASTAARAVYGMVLLARPGVLLGAVGARRDELGLRYATRLLGARHLAQAAASHSGALPLGLSVLVDAVHAASALIWGTLSRRHRRVAFADAGLAAGWAADGALLERARRR